MQRQICVIKEINVSNVAIDVEFTSDSLWINVVDVNDAFNVELTLEQRWIHIIIVTSLTSIT